MLTKRNLNEATRRAVEVAEAARREQKIHQLEYEVESLRERNNRLVVGLILTFSLLCFTLLVLINVTGGLL